MTNESLSPVWSRLTALRPVRGPRRRQMAGPGSVLAFEVVGGYPAAAAVAKACKLICHAVSLGGTETLIEHPASLTHRPVAAEARPNPGLLRISIGLESLEDLCADLDKALKLDREPLSR